MVKISPNKHIFDKAIPLNPARNIHWFTPVLPTTGHSKTTLVGSSHLVDMWGGHEEHAHLGN